MMFNKPDLTIADEEFWNGFFNKKLVFSIIPIILGLSASFSFAPYSIWALVIVNLAILIYILHKLENAKRVFVASLCFFASMNTATLSWLNFVMQDFGELPFLLSWLIEILFSLYLASPYALCFALSYKISKNNVVAFVMCLIPLSIVIADFIIGYLFTGFPWMYIGYASLNSPLSSYAPLIGVRGIDLMMALLASAFMLAVTRRYVFFPIVGVIFVISLLFMHYEFTKEHDDKYKFTMVQGNIEQSVKWNANQVVPTVRKYLDLSNNGFKDGNIIIWPESAIPLYLQGAFDILDIIKMRLNDNNATLITGIQNHDKDTNKSYNSIISLNKDSNLDNLAIYNKRQLVPFGEIVPFESILRPLGSIFNFPMSSFSRGEYIQDPIFIKDLKLIPSICYESIFPELMTSFDKDNINGILMVSNDSWFGLTRGPLEHLEIARMRVLELQKPMLRVTNSGFSVFINKNGEVENAIEQNTADFVDVDFKKVTGSTPYSRFGNIPLYIMCIMLMLFAFISIKKNFDPLNDTLSKMVRP